MNKKINSVCEKVKKNKVEKVAFALRLPRKLKKELEGYCKSNNVSLNAFIVSVLEDFIELDLDFDFPDISSLFLPPSTGEEFFELVKSLGLENNKELKND